MFLITDDIISPDIQYGGFQPTQTEDHDSYGSPQADPVSAPDSYGSPQAPPVSAPDSYGSPQAPPADSYDSPAPVSAPDNYGSPQAPPVSAPDNYGSPQADPLGDSYNSPGSGSAPLSASPLPPSGVSLDTPVESFIPQVGRNPPDIAKSKSSKAIQNSNNYDPFDYQDQVSWSFFYWH